MKQNRSNLKGINKKEPFDKSAVNASKPDKWEDPVQLSESERLKLNKKILTEARMVKRRELIFVLVVLTIGTGLFIFVTVKWVI